MINENNEKINNTMNIMVDRNILHVNSDFNISEFHLNKYIEIYNSLGQKSNGKFCKNFARKLAGLSLIKYKLSFSKLKDCREGFVYIIGNPSWPDHVKLGMTYNLEKRLQSYQTYDPFKRYFVKNYDFVLDRRKVENTLLKRYSLDIENGEWVKDNEAIDIINYVRNEENIPLPKNKKQI